jgi:hypothetical protein
VSKHYSPAVSNYLREPLLVNAMRQDLESLPDSIKQSPRVATLIEAMPALYGIVNIPIEGSIPKEGVDKLMATAKGLVEKIVGG